MPRSRSLPIPREHGAYVVLVTCWLFGILTAGSVEALPAALSLATAFAGFTLSEPARLLAQSLRSGRNAAGRPGLVAWVAALALAAAATGIPLAMLRPEILWALLPSVALFALYLWLTSRRAAMVDLSIIGFIGLSIVAPIARVAAGPAWSIWELAAIWSYTALFFCASAWCVRVRLVGVEGIPLAAAAHTALLALTAILVARDILPLVALVAIVPALARFVWVWLDVARYRRQTLKRIGLLETALALALILAGVLY
jgi:hypothetical protein